LTSFRIMGDQTLELERLFETTAGIPIVTAGRVSSVGKDGKVDEITIETSQKDCRTNKTRKNVTTLYPHSHGNGWKGTRPVEIQKVLGTFPSPSGNLVATVVAADAKPGAGPESPGVFHVIISTRLETLQTISTEGKHGKVFVSGTFGGFSWSRDESKIAYIAEPNPPKRPNFFDEPPAEKNAKEDDDATGDEAAENKKKLKNEKKSAGPGEAFEWQEHWGEILTDAKSPACVVMDLKTRKIKVLDGGPENVSFAQVQFCPDSASLVAVGYPEKPRKLGATYYNTRPSSLYHIPITLDDDDDDSEKTPKKDQKDQKGEGGTAAAAPAPDKTAGSPDKMMTKKREVDCH